MAAIGVWAVADLPAIRDSGLHIMVGQSKDDLVAAANRRLDEDIAILTVVSLLLFAGVWTLGELGIRRQVGRLAAMATKLGLGDLSARIAPPFPGGELGGLMTVLNGTAESLERQRSAIDDLNQKLRHSQKMEELGQLTGGIAHDFNNMLTVITGTIDILSEAVADKPRLAAIAKLISEAADRGAEMTGHLLAFSRKQPLQPRETDIGILMGEADQLLRSTLGEHIEIETIARQDVWPALVDPSQLSSALLNLAINARDAMPGGGKLTLEASNVILDQSYPEGDIQPGNYVSIAVSDTGTGIPAAIRDKIFEPFFSTKDVGKGTGLGLSMVYGFVKQSGGNIKVYSEEGHGTTFRIYLPQARHAEFGNTGRGIAGSRARGQERDHSDRRGRRPGTHLRYLPAQKPRLQSDTGRQCRRGARDRRQRRTVRPSVHRCGHARRLERPPTRRRGGATTLAAQGSVYVRLYAGCDRSPRTPGPRSATARQALPQGRPCPHAPCRPRRIAAAGRQGCIARMNPC